MNKSRLFQVYNSRLKLAVKEGRIEAGRARRGLGVAQSHRLINQGGTWYYFSQNDKVYRVTPQTCTCPDFHANGVRYCKHSIGVSLRILAERVVDNQE